MAARPEILAPAGSREALTAAVRCGADAVYLGGTAYSARAGAANFDLDALREAAAFCRLYGVKIHLAVNTLMRDGELEGLAAYLREAVPLVDACIVQDLGAVSLLHGMFPDLPIHASTQMSLHSPAGAREAAALGCSRVVAAREMSRDDLAKLCREPVEVEVFVHGALCMSVSGQCSFSAAVGGRSANRGKCAQACRLPWRTPSGRDPAALSLKDLSLVSHVQTLAEMGVASFKIEGRMKRPEYVAAAVTAVRQALDGQTPDMERLRAVFSRSGFTDGYFTGRKKDMFGTRRKEDVTAAAGVLGELSRLYERPRKCAVLDTTLTLRSGAPSVLTASDRDGRSVTVQGDVPAVPERAPLRQEVLAKSMAKLGDTIYVPGETVLDDTDGLFLSAAQCNALRRDAVAQMDAQRIAEHTPVYPYHETPVLPSARRTRGETSVRLHVRTKGQLDAARDTGHTVCIPLTMAAQCAPAMSIWLESPRIIADEDAYAAKLAALRAAGWQHLVCHNLADIRLGREAGLTLHGGFGLNAANRRTASVLADMGLADVCASIELDGRGIRALSDVLPAEGFVYGRLPLMLLRVCPIKAHDGCRRHDCYMTDRTARQFPLLCSGHYQELCNAERLWLAGDRLFEDGPEILGLYFTDEPPARIGEVLAAYRDGAGDAPKARTKGMYHGGGLR